MSKTFLKIALIFVVIAALAGGSIAIAAAGGDNPTPTAARPSADTTAPVVRQFDLDTFVNRLMQLQNRILVEALLTRAGNAGLITETQAARILNAWDTAHPDWQPPAQRIFNRIMQLHNRNRVEALLTRAQDAGVITGSEAARILNAWDTAHPDWQPLTTRLFNRLMQLQNRNRVEALLTRAQDAGVITESQAARILNAWDTAHPDWQLPAAVETV
jgi:hypothetical protein